MQPLPRGNPNPVPVPLLRAYPEDKNDSKTQPIANNSGFNLPLPHP